MRLRPAAPAVLLEKGVTGSTNDDARALAMEGAAHGTAVLAEAQSAGRGRAGRSWLSPVGGLYLSVVLRPGARPASWSVLPLAFGAAVVRVLREQGFAGAGLKWPNDVWLGHEKVGGILVEARPAEASPFVVVGLGLNLTEAPIEGATALARHGAPPPRRELAEALRAAFVDVARRLDAGEAPAVLDEVRALCVSLGRKVEWEEGVGVAADIADDGSLVVLRTDGERVRVVAGDVRIRWSD